VSELTPNQEIDGVFLVQFKEVRQKRTGEPYLVLNLIDRTGELDAKMWDNAAAVAETFDRDDFVRVRGLIQIFQNRPQLTVHRLNFVSDEDVDLADFLPASKRNAEEMFAELTGVIRGITNPQLKALLAAFFADTEIARLFKRAPAAKTVHHAYVGGLLEHVLSMVALARMSAAQYPDIDLDLLLAGVILHDVGKIRELNYERSFSYSTEGQLLGHIQIGLAMLAEKVRAVPGFPQKTRILLEHMILSHHGALEYGSPKVPVFPEAMLLHLIDNMDSKMGAVLRNIELDSAVDGEWTGYIPPLERSLLKKERYLSAQASPAAPAPAAMAPAAVPPEKPSTPFGQQLADALTPKI
jgi:3'-5' exoribonuclease